MRSSILTALAALVPTTALLAQTGLSGSASGNSSIPFRGNTVGLNITDLNLEFSVSNMDSTVGRKCDHMWGVGAKAGNKEGTGLVFSTGDFVSEASMQGYFGLTWSKDEVIPLMDYSRLKNELAAYKAGFDEQYKRDMRAAILKVNATTDATRALLVKLLSLLGPEGGGADVNTMLVPANFVSDPQEQAAAIALRAEHDRLMKEYSASRAPLEKRLGDFDSQERYKNKAKHWQAWTWLFGGSTGRDFKRIGAVDTLNVAKSFSKEQFRGGFFGIGGNYQRGSVTLGATYQYSMVDNFDALEKSDYVLRTSNTTGNQTLIKEEKIAGYAGTYAQVERNDLRFDVVWSLAMDTTLANHVFLNGYLRRSMWSRDPLLLPDRTDVGAGIYFLDKTGKFLGGLYVEVPDVDQGLEKLKPEVEQNLRPWEQRVTFGIVTKFAFASILKLY